MSTGAERTYVAGWIKRGPSGVIGTNKKDASETVELLLDDRAGLLAWRDLEELLDAGRATSSTRLAGDRRVERPPASRSAGRA